MSGKPETLDVENLPSEVRRALESYLQHREQMRGKRDCVGISLNSVIVHYEPIVQSGPTTEERDVDDPDEAIGLHSTESKEQIVGWECTRPLFAPSDSDDTPWAV